MRGRPDCDGRGVLLPCFWGTLRGYAYIGQLVMCVCARAVFCCRVDKGTLRGYAYIDFLPCCGRRSLSVDWDTLGHVRAKGLRSDSMHPLSVAARPAHPLWSMRCLTV